MAYNTYTSISNGTKIRCLQINLQHSRAATGNLQNFVHQCGIDIIFAQEPYVINNKVAGMSHHYKIITQGNGKIRAAIIIANRNLDALLIRQLSDEDTVLVEITDRNLKFFAMSAYFDIVEDMTINLRKMDNILQFTAGSALLTAVDSNARSTSWHDAITNSRGRQMEDYLSTNHLHILNEESDNTTFENRRGKSNIDLTIVNNAMLSRVSQWNYSDQESCSDHRYITFTIAQNLTYQTPLTFRGIKYIVNPEKLEDFDATILREYSTIVSDYNTTGDVNSLDEELCNMANAEPDTSKLVTEYEKIVNAACKANFKTRRPTQKLITERSVPWWSDELTILRKKINALRRRYQRTKLDEQLRQVRQAQYHQEKRKYENAIRRQKAESWKQYCSLTPSNNPWNAVYRMSAGKIRNTTQLTTLKTADGTYTRTIQETMNHMMEHFVPNDSKADDSDYHKQIRQTVNTHINTPDDKEFTNLEISSILEEMDPKKAPGEDGITSAILLRVFNLLPKFVTAVYNSCLTKGIFPEQWKSALIMPIEKPGNDRDNATRFRPISLLNTGGKVLEKLLINRIMYQSLPTATKPKPVWLHAAKRYCGRFDGDEEIRGAKFQRRTICDTCKSRCSISFRRSMVAEHLEHT